MNRTAIVGPILAACLLVAGCGGSAHQSTASHPSTPPSTTSSTPSTGAASSAGPTSSQPSAAGVTITIKNFGYTVSGTAAPAAKISVTNNDNTAHSVTADSGGGFDMTVLPGKTATFAAPDKAGSYKFHCSFHSNMHGELTVAG